MDEFKPFSPAIDWSNGLVDSLIWIGEAWAITAFGTLVVLILIARFTIWGRQFWAVTGAYFTGRHSVRPWLSLGAMLLSVIVGVRLNVLFSYQSNDLYSAASIAVQGHLADNQAVKNSGVWGFWLSLMLFALLATILVTRLLVDLFITQRFMLAWRAWLTDRLTVDWLDERAYYRSRFIDQTIDNPDQRIQYDIDVFTAISGPQPNTPHQTSNGTLLFGAISAIVSVVSFTHILWNLSGPVSLFGVTLPRALFWSVFIYVAFATVIAFWLGRPLIRLSFNNEKFTPRSATRWCGYATPPKPSRSTAARVGAGPPARAVRRRAVQLPGLMNRTMIFTGRNFDEQPLIPLPWLMQAPRLLPARSNSARHPVGVGVRSIHDALSFFRNAYDVFAGYRASIPVARPADADEQSRAMPKVASSEADGADRAPRRRGPPARRRAADQRPAPAAGCGRVADHHREVGHWQVHPVAQPGRALALRLGTMHARAATTDDVPVPAALRSARRPSHRGVLSARARRAPRWVVQEVLEAWRRRANRPARRRGDWAKGSPPASSNASRSPGSC